MRKILIIDDEQDARSLIREYLEAFSAFEIIGECENGFDAIKKINQLEPDIVFLDIKMPGLSGFQVVQQLIHMPQVIFTTAYDQYALKAFEANAIDYLLKPYTADRFGRAMQKVSVHYPGDFLKTQRVANEYTGQAPTRILVENGNKFIALNVEHIIFFEAEKDYTHIHTEDKTYLSNFGIGVLEQRMSPALFLRIHRSYIINIHCIKEVTREGYSVQVTMKNNKVLNVSRKYMDELKKLLY
ncbi:MAG: LytTR family transcriptional regulator DNA-binding domain-containing protein [Chitinophaga sp.]|uniref:LytR/AlgR family response regulator transcription factor n=1 Tax=Chitinophaga sp. TaxID=1869181 RepID=UPI001B04539E|nr:LytTR family transcriptional regulator DNA-binding domain-containing protein [Chitinophaga sp.]MBO9732057.1 LytTR family transcriptional regulator DNA-binding domain-containing protein [Chitinophaga sp.]